MALTLIDDSNYGPFEANQFFLSSSTRSGFLVQVDTPIPLGDRPILEVELLGAESLYINGGANLPVYEFWARQFRPRFYYDYRVFAATQCRITRVDSFQLTNLRVKVWHGRP